MTVEIVFQDCDVRHEFDDAIPCPFCEIAALKARLADAERWKDRARAVLPLIPRTVGTDLAAEVSWLLRAADSAGEKP